MSHYDTQEPPGEVYESRDFQHEWTEFSKHKEDEVTAEASGASECSKDTQVEISSEFVAPPAPAGSSDSSVVAPPIATNREETREEAPAAPVPSGGSDSPVAPPAGSDSPVAPPIGGNEEKRRLDSVGSGITEGSNVSVTSGEEGTLDASDEDSEDSGQVRVMASCSMISLQEVFTYAGPNNRKYTLYVRIKTN